MGEGSAEVPIGQSMGMLGSFDGLKLRPGEQLVGRNQSFPHFLVVLGEVGNALGDVFGMEEEKGHVESTSCIQNRSRLFQVCSFAGIGSSLFPLSESKGEFCGTHSLSHLESHLPGTNVPSTSIVVSWSNFVNIFGKSFLDATCHPRMEENAKRSGKAHPVPPSSACHGKQFAQQAGEEEEWWSRLRFVLVCFS